LSLLKFREELAEVGSWNWIGIQKKS
jgi:hypothetical protein